MLKYFEKPGRNFEVFVITFILAREVKLEIDKLHTEFCHMWRHLLLLKVMKNQKSLRSYANFYYQYYENVLQEFCRNVLS